jgi:molecular chaperone DnaK (HSP70)
MPSPKPPPDTRKPFQGRHRSLVIAIDIGTTFSGVSYAILDPGEIPKIHGVTRFTSLSILPPCADTS